VGNPPDQRSQSTATTRGIDMSDLRARQVNEGDFAYYDYVVAMDQENYSLLRQQCPREHVDKLYMFMDFAPELNTREVPDPYYGGAQGFERVFDLVDAASRGLLAEVQSRF
jgi:protein-tyrosine phosphatase